MLYLGDGLRQGKVSETQTLYLFPDFSDPMTFYALPNFPHIAKMDGGAPAIRLLVYREDLDVDLSWPPQLIEDARSKLRIEDQLAAKPRISPIFFSKGSVKLMLLDAV